MVYGRDMSPRHLYLSAIWTRISHCTFEAGGKMKRIWIALLTLAVGLTLSSAAFAKGHDKGNKGGSHGNSATSTEHGHGHDSDDGDHDSQGPKSRPKGWDQGKKTGWGDCD